MAVLVSDLMFKTISAIRDHIKDTLTEFVDMEAPPNIIREFTYILDSLANTEVEIKNYDTTCKLEAADKEYNEAPSTAEYMRQIAREEARFVVATIQQHSGVAAKEQCEAELTERQRAEILTVAKQEAYSITHKALSTFESEKRAMLQAVKEIARTEAIIVSQEYTEYAKKKATAEHAPQARVEAADKREEGWKHWGREQKSDLQPPPGRSIRFDETERLWGLDADLEDKRDRGDCGNG